MRFLIQAGSWDCPSQGTVHMPLPPLPGGAAGPLIPEKLSLLPGPVRTQGGTKPRTAMNSQEEESSEDIVQQRGQPEGDSGGRGAWCPAVPTAPWIWVLGFFGHSQRAGLVAWITVGSHRPNYR